VFVRSQVKVGINGCVCPPAGPLRAPGPLTEIGMSFHLVSVRVLQPSCAISVLTRSQVVSAASSCAMRSSTATSRSSR
jgi:hypothetical protein